MTTNTRNKLLDEMVRLDRVVDNPHSTPQQIERANVRLSAIWAQL